MKMKRPSGQWLASTGQLLTPPLLAVTTGIGCAFGFALSPVATGSTIAGVVFLTLFFWSVRIKANDAAAAAATSTPRSPHDENDGLLKSGLTSLEDGGAPPTSGRRSSPDARGGGSAATLVSCVAAVLAGALAGKVAADIHGHAWAALRHSRAYNNVAVAEPAAARADAGFVNFTAPATVAVAHAGSVQANYVGDLTGSTYCAAPIEETDKTAPLRGSAPAPDFYWQVGRDCCSAGVWTCGTKPGGVTVRATTAALPSWLRRVYSLAGLGDGVDGYLAAISVSSGRFDRVPADEVMLLLASESAATAEAAHTTGMLNVSAMISGAAGIIMLLIGAK